MVSKTIIILQEICPYVVPKMWGNTERRGRGDFDGNQYVGIGTDSDSKKSWQDMGFFNS